MPRASKQRRSEIVDTINAALGIVDDVAQDGDGELVRAVVASFALKQISEGDYEDDREDEDEDLAPEEDEEEQDDEEEEPQRTTDVQVVGEQLRRIAGIRGLAGGEQALLRGRGLVKAHPARPLGSGDIHAQNLSPILVLCNGRPQRARS